MKLLTLLLLISLSGKAQLTTIGGHNTWVNDPGKPAPLLIAFSGNGQGGTNANLLFTDGIPYLVNSGFKIPVNAFVVCPQAGSGSFKAADVPALIKAIKARYPLADTTQLYLTGFSAGGLTVMEAITVKPKHALPMSAAGGGAYLVDFIASNKIPVTHWVGANEDDHIGWTLYQVKQKGGITTTFKVNCAGHCGWKETLRTAAFWDLIKPSATPPPTPLSAFAGNDITVQLPAVAQLSGSGTGEGLQYAWKSLTAGSSAFSNPSTAGATFSATDIGRDVSFTLQLTVTDKFGKTATDDVVVTFKPAPKPPEPKELFKIYISGVDFFGLDNGTVRRSKGKWSNTSGVLVAFPCGEQTITITNNAKWTKK